MRSRGLSAGVNNNHYAGTFTRQLSRSVLFVDGVGLQSEHHIVFKYYEVSGLEDPLFILPKGWSMGLATFLL